MSFKYTYFGNKKVRIIIAKSADDLQTELNDPANGTLIMNIEPRPECWLLIFEIP